MLHWYVVPGASTLMIPSVTLVSFLTVTESPSGVPGRCRVYTSVSARSKSTDGCQLNVIGWGIVVNWIVSPFAGEADPNGEGRWFFTVNWTLSTPPPGPGFVT